MGIISLSVALLAAAASPALAHPGKEEVKAHRAVPLEQRSLDHCNKAFNHPEFLKRTLDRLGPEFSRVRRSLGVEAEDEPMVHKRDYISVSRINHLQNKTVSFTTDPATLFADAGACILMPAVDQGPLYVKGEQVRKDITEGQAGIKMTLAIQVVDISGCAPVTGAYLDIWSSNSTGMYVGVQGYPGMGDPNDASILKGTALRGVQPVDEHGIAVFDTLLPGHYEGRATHIHAIVYQGATKQPNNTITGGRAQHVGQIYFDQPLLTNVDKISPYSSNTMAVTPNVRDMLFMAGANGDDPIVKYALVGNKLEDGVFAWIRFGVRANANMNVNPAAFWTKDGGVMNPTGPVAQMNRFSGGGFGGFGGFGGGAGAGKMPGWPMWKRLVRKAGKKEE